MLLLLYQGCLHSIWIFPCLSFLMIEFRENFCNLPECVIILDPRVVIFIPPSLKSMCIPSIGQFKSRNIWILITKHSCCVRDQVYWSTFELLSLFSIESDSTQNMVPFSTVANSCLHLSYPITRTHCEYLRWKYSLAISRWMIQVRIIDSTCNKLHTIDPPSSVYDNLSYRIVPKAYMLPPCDPGCVCKQISPWLRMSLCLSR